MGGSVSFADDTPADQKSPAQSAKADATASVSSRTFVLSKFSLTLAKQGDLLFRRGELDTAARQFTGATEAAPHDPVLREMLGVALIAAGQAYQALPEFREAVRLADDDPVAAMLLQSAIAEQGDADEAQALDHEIYRRFGRGSGSDRIIDASRSIARLTQRAEKEPDSAVLQLLLGDAYQLQQDWTNADQAYTRAIRIAPFWSKPLINRGLSQSSQQNYAAAIDTLGAALRLDPANVRAKVWLGDADLHDGRNGHAITLLKGVMADKETIAPTVRGQAAMILGQAYSKTGDYTKAVASLDEAQRLAPGDPTPSAVLGEVQVQAGNYAAMTDAYQNAIRLSDSSSLFADRSILYRALADAQISFHRPNDALATLRQAMAADPANDSVWHRLTAQAQFDRGNATAGQEELCQSINAEEASYPIDALNAASGRSLLPTIQAHYQSLLQSAGGDTVIMPETAAITPSTASGLMANSRSRSVKIRIHPDVNEAAQAASDRIRALSALAHIARYQNHTAEEIGLRRQLTTLRTRATDWYLLAEACDDRAQTPIPAREAYKQALELKEGLSPAQIARATKRLAVLTGVAYKP